MSKFSVVEFDLSSNAIKLGDQWHKCVDLSDQCNVGLVSKSTLESSAESIATVRCDPSTYDSLATPNQARHRLSHAMFPSMFLL